MCQRYRERSNKTATSGGVSDHATDLRLELRFVPVVNTMAVADHWGQASNSNAIVLLTLGAVKQAHTMDD